MSRGLLQICLFVSSVLCFFQEYPVNSVAYLHPLAIKNPSLETLDLAFVHKRGDDSSATWLPAKFEISLDLSGRNVSMILEHNANAVHPSGTIEIIKDGVVMSRQMPNNAFIGRIIGEEDSSMTENFLVREILHTDDVPMVAGPSLARFVVDLHHTGDNIIIEGVFMFNNELYTVKKIEHYKLHKRSFDAELPEMAEKNGSSPEMVIYKHEKPSDPNFKAPVYKCGHDHLHYNFHPSGAATFFADEYMKQSSPRLQSRGTAGCPTSKKILYMGIAADCSYVKVIGDETKAASAMLQNMNIVSGIYEKFFNIGIGVITLKIYPTCSTTDAAWNRDCSSSYDITTRLSDFSAWRKTQSADAGLWHLFTACNSGSVVGVAWLNQVCQTSSFQTSSSNEWVSGTGVSSYISNHFAVVAHEIGHNFGAIHDCDSSTCSTCSGSSCPCCVCGTCDCQGKYIMSPESGGLSVQDFSPCSQTEICKKIPIFGKCLAEPGSKAVIQEGVCGNGIKEANEQCDCGTNCTLNACCTSNCTFKGSAVCDDADEECCSNCQYIPASANKVCRAKADSCQQDTFCNGTSGLCPATQTLADGSSCEFSDGKCASGLCTSRDRQCLLIGSRYGVTGACGSSSSCSMICQTASGCVYTDAFFIDGTPCGSSGFCSNGSCSGSSAISSWIQDNLILFIVIVSVVGLVILGIIIKCLFSSKKKRTIR